MIDVLIGLVRLLSQLLFVLVLLEVILSYFMSPYHPVRSTISRIVEPMLSPIRRVVPPIQRIDLSPLVLIILIQVVEYLLIVFLSGLR